MSWLVWIRILPRRMSLQTAVRACSMVSPALSMDTPVIWDEAGGRCLQLCREQQLWLLPRVLPRVGDRTQPSSPHRPHRAAHTHALYTRPACRCPALPCRHGPSSGPRCSPEALQFPWSPMVLGPTPWDGGTGCPGSPAARHQAGASGISQSVPTRHGAAACPQGGEGQDISPSACGIASLRTSSLGASPP